MLVTVVVLTAILPTILAQRWFTPPEAIGGPGRGGADAIYREAYQLVLHLPGLQRVVDLLADVSELASTPISGRPYLDWRAGGRN